MLILEVAFYTAYLTVKSLLHMCTNFRALQSCNKCCKKFLEEKGMIKCLHGILSWLEMGK